MRVLVTGATGGIGRGFAARLVEQGHDVWLHGRDAARLDALAQELGGSCTPVVADLGALADAEALAHGVAGQVDVVVHNAGVGFGADRTERETSADGVELRLAVNYLAPVAMDRRFFAAVPHPRAVLHVASIGQAPVRLGDPELAHDYDGYEAYRRSKLALIMHSFDLAAAHPEARVLALHPGSLLDTGMVRQAGLPVRGPASKGVDVLEHVLDAALVEGVTGTYFDEMVPARVHDQAYDASVREQLARWAEARIDGIVGRAGR